ncbi:MAG TPA: alpha-2-macroglobulin family protein, partial [Flavisolibacter sp.]
TRTGASTNAYGRFTLRTLPNSTIVISSVGYGTEERKMDGNRDFRFSLAQVKNSLEEVVVVGYGSQRKMSLTASVTSVTLNQLAGKVAGITIRGTNSITGATSPLIIIDGIPYSGSLSDLDPSLIAATEVLKDENAKALYGAKAENGVVIVTTKKGKENAGAIDPLMQAANSLRTAFRDDAWWQPKLRTNAAGIASFRTTYPDDITAWQTFAIAMTDQRQSGSAQALVRSFKAVSGNLALPQFAIEGDSLAVIGKALNYLPDSIQAKRSFYINGQLVNERGIGFRNAWIDTFSVVAATSDSLKLKYTVQKPDGYFDGEERKLPVFKQGVKEVTGFFAALRSDTAFAITPKSDTSLVKIYAETSVLPTLEKEVEFLRAYEYLCNEQLASKLKGLLAQKRIDSLLKRPFRFKKQATEIITKLVQAKHTTGLWGWWAANEPAMWISLHVTEALVQASAQGFSVPINKRALTDYLVYQLENESGTEQLSALHLLHLLGAKADYKKYSDSLRKSLPRMSLYSKLRLAELEQKAGLEFSIDSLLGKQSRTMMGNVYWGEEGYRFFDNAIQNTIIMYRLLKAAGGHNDLLDRMRGYFLERRRSGNWRNTYESSLILETILPDLLVNDSLPKASTISIGSQTVNRFPYATEARGGQVISITKQGPWPVYFTAYEERWNPAPKKVTGDFTVHTVFEKKEETISKLKGGEPVTLKATVSVKADAEYVMVEIPIPAGCSYNDKRQSYSNNEVHREYFKNKVSIFCSALKKGEYVFTVSLLPRYTGKYNLNPAKAELMYFPVFYGREGMKKIAVE